MRCGRRFGLMVRLEVALISAFVAVTAGAQEVELPKIVVYDFPDSSIAGREATSSLTVIDRDEIEQSGAADVYELISGRVPGVFVNERGIFNYGIGTGSAGQITIRGLGGTPNTEILVLLDGQPMKMGIFGHPIPDAYPLEEVERVEVLRGSHSLHYGDCALGGVVNIVTRKLPGEAGISTRVSGGGGEFHSYKAGLENSGRTGKFSYFGSILRRETEGHRPNSAFRGWNVYAKGGYRISDNWQVVLNGWGIDYTVEDPGTVSNPRSEDSRDVTRGGGGVTLYNNFDATSGSLMVYGQRGRHDFTEVFDDGWKSHDRTTGAIAHQSFALFDDNRLEIGGDIQESGGEGEDVKIDKNYGRFYDTEGGIYLDDEQAFWEALTLQAGLRLQMARYAEAVWIPRAGARYQLFPSTVLHGQVGKGYRTPTIRERYLFPPSTLDLQPEEAWNYELGVRQHFGSLLSLNLAGFYFDADNLIVFRPPEASNTGAVVGRGVEVAAVLAPWEWYEMLVSYTYLDQNKRVEGVAGNVVKWINRFFWRSGSFQIDLSGVDGLKFSDRDESYCVTDLKLSYKLLENTEMTFRVNNVFATPYQVVEGYPMPGRWLWGEVSFRF